MATKKEQCCVCVEDYPPELSCGHFVCTKCVVKSGKRECPLCRQPVALTKCQKKKLRRNASKYKKDQIREDTGEVLREQVDALETQDPGTITIQMDDVGCHGPEEQIIMLDPRIPFNPEIDPDDERNSKRILDIRAAAPYGTRAIFRGNIRWIYGYHYNKLEDENISIRPLCL